MQYNYKCSKCGEIKEITILTHDIIKSRGIVDQVKLSERMYEPRQCECGGELKKIITYKLTPFGFETGVGYGKISQRFK